MKYIILIIQLLVFNLVSSQQSFYNGQNFIIQEIEKSLIHHKGRTIQEVSIWKNLKDEEVKIMQFKFDTLQNRFTFIYSEFENNDARKIKELYYEYNSDSSVVSSIETERYGIISGFPYIPLGLRKSEYVEYENDQLIILETNYVLGSERLEVVYNEMRLPHKIKITISDGRTLHYSIKYR